jgi:hypothetical protein
MSCFLISRDSAACALCSRRLICQVAASAARPGPSAAAFHPGPAAVAVGGLAWWYMQKQKKAPRKNAPRKNDDVDAGDYDGDAGADD